MSAERRAKLLVPELQKAENWQEFHEILFKNHAYCNLKTSGVVIKFVDNDTVVKCSRVHRGFSRANLEKKFGPYEPLEPLINNGVEKMELQQTQQIDQQPQPQPQPQEQAQPQQSQQPQEPQEPQQPQEQPEPEHNNALVNFINKTASDSTDVLKDETLLSSLHSHYSCVSDKETMFNVISEDMKKCGITTLSETETKTISDKVFDLVNTAKIEEQKEVTQEEKPEKQEEKGTAIDLSNIDNPLELLLLLILAILGFDIARRAAEAADEAAAQAAALAAQEQEQTQEPEAPAPAPAPEQQQDQQQQQGQEQGQQQEQGQEPKLEPAPTPAAAPRPEPAASPQPVAADWAPCGMLYRDVYKYAAEHIAAGYAHKNFAPPVGPKLDTAVAVRLAVSGYNQSQITAAIAAGSPSASTSPDYASAKAAEPFAATQTQVAKYADKAESCRKEEKKDVISVQREYQKAGIAVPAELRQKPKQNKGMTM